MWKEMGPLLGEGDWGNSQPLCITVDKPRNTQREDEEDGKLLETNRTASSCVFSLSLSHLEYSVATAFSVAQKSLQVGHYFQHSTLDLCNMLYLEFPWKTSQKPQIMGVQLLEIININRIGLAGSLRLGTKIYIWGQVLVQKTLKFKKKKWIK